MMIQHSTVSSLTSLASAVGVNTSGAQLEHKQIMFSSEQKTLHVQSPARIINKTPIIINRKTIFMVARYHGCLVNLLLTPIVSDSLPR
jgi:hypothetical protein